MYKLPVTALGVGGVFVNTFRLWCSAFSSNFPLCWLLNAWTIMGFVLPGILFLLMAPFLNLNHLSIGVFSLIMVGIFLIILAAMLYYVLLFAFTGALYDRTYQIMVGERGSFRESVGIGLERALWLFLGSVLQVIILIIAIIGLIIPLIPAIFLLIILQFQWLIIVVEGVEPVEALVRCWHLVKGSWWHTFLSQLLVWIVVLAGLVLLLVIFGLLFAHPLLNYLRSAWEGGQPSLSVTWIYLFVEVTLVALGYLLYLANAMVLYHNLKLRQQEETELENLAKAPEGDTTTSN